MSRTATFFSATLVVCSTTLWVRAADDGTTPTRKPRLSSAGTFSGTIKHIRKSGDQIIITLAVPTGKSMNFVKFGQVVASIPFTHDTKVTLVDNVKVRLPFELDAKGRIKPGQRDPKDPDVRLPGQKGSVDDLKEGQGVAITLGRPGKNMPVVGTMVLIVQQETANAQGGAPKNKKP